MAKKNNAKDVIIVDHLTRLTNYSPEEAKKIRETGQRIMWETQAAIQKYSMTMVVSGKEWKSIKD
tara:strand:+ start:276 stop:470 length:195 start_codon:yes stop_codon:yes gene_type:complete